MHGRGTYAAVVDLDVAKPGGGEALSASRASAVGRGGAAGGAPSAEAAVSRERSLGRAPGGVRGELRVQGSWCEGHLTGPAKFSVGEGAITTRGVGSAGVGWGKGQRSWCTEYQDGRRQQRWIAPADQTRTGARFATAMPEPASLLPPPPPPPPPPPAAATAATAGAGSRVSTRRQEGWVEPSRGFSTLQIDMNVPVMALPEAVDIDAGAWVRRRSGEQGARSEGS